MRRLLLPGKEKCSRWCAGAKGSQASGCLSLCLPSRLSESSWDFPLPLCLALSLTLLQPEGSLLTPSPTSGAGGDENKGTAPWSWAGQRWVHGAASLSKTTSPIQGKTQAPAVGWLSGVCWGQPTVGGFPCQGCCPSCRDTQRVKSSTKAKGACALGTGTAVHGSHVRGPSPAQQSNTCYRAWRRRRRQFQDFSSAARVEIEGVPSSIAQTSAEPPLVSQCHSPPWSTAVTSCNQDRLPWKPFIRCS